MQKCVWLSFKVWNFLEQPHLSHNLGYEKVPAVLSTKREGHPRQRKQGGQGLKHGDAFGVAATHTKRPVAAWVDGRDEIKEAGGTR